MHGNASAHPSRIPACYSIAEQHTNEETALHQMHEFQTGRQILHSLSCLKSKTLRAISMSPAEVLVCEMQGLGWIASLGQAEAEDAHAWADGLSTAPNSSGMPSQMPLRLPLKTPPEVRPGYKGVTLTCQAPKAWLVKQAQPDLQLTLEAQRLPQPAL